MIKLLILAPIVSLWVLSLFQVIPSSLDRFFDDFPFIAVVVFLWLMSDKRLERILDVQLQFFKTILERSDTRQDQMADNIKLLADQVSMNTAATHEAINSVEIAKKDDILEQLLDRFSDDRRGGVRDDR